MPTVHILATGYVVVGPLPMPSGGALHVVARVFD